MQRLISKKFFKTFSKNWIDERNLNSWPISLLRYNSKRRVKSVFIVQVQKCTISPDSQSPQLNCLNKGNFSFYILNEISRINHRVVSLNRKYTNGWSLFPDDWGLGKEDFPLTFVETLFLTSGDRGEDDLDLLSLRVACFQFFDPSYE